jgi:predicted TIM-barrel fold metal-dependent hydrolase
MPTERRLAAIMFTVVMLLGSCASAPDPAGVPAPIIDMHLHAAAADSQGPPPVAICTPIDPCPAWDPQRPYRETWIAMLKQPACSDPVWSPETDEAVMSATIEVVNRLNIYGVLSGTPERVAKWRTAAPGRFIPARAPQRSSDVPESKRVAELRQLHSEGRLAVVAEFQPQYAGLPPDDERLEPIWALAEELDIPVGIHIGPGPPGVMYLGAGNYRARLHSPLTLEPVLVRHPGLRVYIMHAGYPMLDDLLAVLYVHPQVYVDVGVIVFTQPRAGFYRYLKGIVDAGFANRVMFGSDQMNWPGVIERSIAVLNEAPFLSAQQKRDILYNNAARFLRLSPDEMARHRSGQ